METESPSALSILVHVIIATALVLVSATIESWTL